jgi:hypothetical protein
MAKKDEQKAKVNGSGNGNKGRLQIFVAGFAVEGGDSVLADGFKAIRDLTDAMRHSGVLAPAPRAKAALAGGSADTSKPDTAAGGTVVDVEQPELQSEETDHAGEEIIEDPSKEADHTPKKKAVPPPCQIVEGLDITAGDMPLKTYVEQKAPRKAQDRLVVVAVWLKKYRQLDEITRHDLYTCYQQMGGSGDWKCQNDFDSTLRVIGGRKGWFTKGTKDGSFNVTIVATNYVDAMVPKA